MIEPRKIKSVLICLALLPVTTICQGNKESVNDGVILYNTACQLCHSEDKSKAMHAPAAFDASAWKLRYKNAKNEVKENPTFKTTDDYFLHQVTIGKGLMHHGGLCEESKLRV